ncbi:MAG TPA: hypothetical protein VE379_04300 [Vicinamibacterales bacterium]|jgi:hypothetical protein|nr:hypothetical protein [Vicinamibacterales bacterium]
MDTEAAPSSSRRPRTSLLVLLGIVLAGAAMVTLRQDAAGPAAPTSNPGRPQQQARGAAFQPEQLDVKIEALSQAAAQPDETDRNPFTFRPKAPPPRPPVPPADSRPRPDPGPANTAPVFTGPPPIPLKFIGVTEAPNVGKIAALTDCRHTVQGVEGDIIDGRYRIVKIGVESLVIEYVDGKGQTTLRMSGQDCVAK